MNGSDFWSRRKAQVEAEERAELAAAQLAEREAREAKLEEKSDAEILEELSLPDPDTLTEGADFKAYLTEAVPQRIRLRALRRLWRVNPVLANLDGLVDYGGDFTDASCVIENMQTAYQVGKGMLKHIEAMAKEAELADTPAEPEVEETEEIEVAALETSEPPAFSTAPLPETPAPMEPEEEIVDLAAQPGPRMRFRFAEEQTA